MDKTKFELMAAEKLATETDKDVVARLAALPALEYDRTRTKAAKDLGVRPATLDTMVKATRANDEGSTAPFAGVEPWPDPVDPASLLSDVAEAVRRFIVCESHQADAVALWVAFTHLIDAVEVAPLAIVNAPEKACGKSQLLILLGRLVARPLPAANSSAAFLFRAVEMWTPTILIDEADTFIRENEELKGLVNAGHTRQNAFVGRVVGDNHEPKLFKVWGAKALAGIALEKHLPDATMSRAIIINMRRKMPGEKVERLRYAEQGLFEELASKLARLGDDYQEHVRLSRPALPNELSDRAQDNWEPLLAIAGCAGEEWIRRATKAALLLSGEADSSQSAGNELLADIRSVFESGGSDRIKTADLIAALVADEEAAWATWNKGRPLTPRQLNRMLAGYGVRSKNVRIGYEQAKGFERADFTDAFSRYISSPTPGKCRPAVPSAANPINTGLCAGRVETLGRVAREPEKVAERDAGRMGASRDGEESESVPLEPAPNKARDGGTDKTGFLGEGESTMPSPQSDESVRSF